MGNNRNLQNAKIAKNDEFYTELSEIEKELCNYKEKFRGKTVFCNCDDPFESNFVKFFLMHFNGFGLKALYATGYLVSDIANTELKVEEDLIPYSLCVTDTKRYLIGDQRDLDIESAKHFIRKEKNKVLTKLLGDENYVAGDFRSQESIELLKKSDIVVTNPPFSLFREYISQLIEFNKHFLVLGNMNSITGKDIFPLFKNNDIWLGCNNGSKEYVVSSKYAIENPDRVYKKNDIYYTKLGNTCWYTNIDHEKRHKRIPLDLGHTYFNHESQYPQYDNFNAINVDRLSNIPCDYSGMLGVPISYMYQHCPEQFEIIGTSGDLAVSVVINGRKHSGRFYINNKRLYDRIVIRKKGA